MKPLFTSNRIRNTLILIFLFGCVVIAVLLSHSFLVNRSHEKTPTLAIPKDSSADLSRINQLFEIKGTPTLFEGRLFSDATTTLYLYKRGSAFPKEVIHGAYSEGLIEGSIPFDGGGVLSLDFINYPAISPFAHATATLSNDGESLSGTLTQSDVTSSRTFVLKKVPPLPDSIPVWIHRVKASWESSPFVDVCDFEVEYPITDDQEINHLIQKAMTKTGALTIEDEATKYIQDCKNRSMDTAKGPHESFVRASLHMTTVIMLNQNGLLSLFFQGDDWGGGAHQIRTNGSVTIDLVKKRVVTLGDLVDSSHLQDFLTYEKQMVLETAYSDIASYQPMSRDEFSRIQDFDELRAFVSSTHFLSSEEQRRRYGSLQDFYLTPEGLVKYYNSYELGSWMNTPRVMIPYQGQPLYSPLRQLSVLQQYLKAVETEGQEIAKRLMNEATTITADTNRWITYTSKKYPYSLKYPPEFLTEIDPNRLHQTQSSPDRPEKLHDFALYYPLPEGFPTSFLVQATRRGEWEKIQPLGYTPLFSTKQWDEEKQFLARAHAGDGCDFLIIKFFPETLGFDQACRVITLHGIPVLDRQMSWSPSTMVGRTFTFYKGDVRYDINVPNGHYEYIDFAILDSIKKGTIIEIGEKIVDSMRFR